MQETPYKQPPRVRIGPNTWERGTRDKGVSYFGGYRDPATGKYQIVKLDGPKNRTEAKRAARALQVKADRREIVAPQNVTLRAVADEYFAVLDSLVTSGERSERTADIYRQQWRAHIQSKLGRVKVQAIQAKHISEVLAAVRAKKFNGGKRQASSSLVDGVYRVLDLILEHALVRGYIASNPARRLSKSEKPKRKNVTEARVLDAKEIEDLIACSLDTYKPVVSTLAYTGLRLSEALGLVWSEIDFEGGVIKVRHQLSRATREKPARTVPLKTDAARREVVLLPQLSAVLKEHRKTFLSHGLYRPNGYVFVTANGGPLYCRNVAERGVGKAARAAGLNRDGIPALTAHDLRHSFASHLIRAGADVYSVSRQLGHARASITLDVYAGEFAKVQQHDALRSKLAAAFGGEA
jgi:integrase